jgi:hypothetical protein
MYMHACGEQRGIERMCMHCAAQVMAAHEECLRRVMKGCLLSRKVKVLRALMELKTLAHRFASASGRLAPKQDAQPPGALDPATGARGCLAPPLLLCSVPKPLSVLCSQALVSVEFKACDLLHCLSCRPGCMRQQAGAKSRAHPHGCCEVHACIEDTASFCPATEAACVASLCMSTGKRLSDRQRRLARVAEATRYVARVAGDAALYAGPIAELQRDFTLRFNAFIAGTCTHARPRPRADVKAVC